MTKRIKNGEQSQTGTLNQKNSSCLARCFSLKTERGVLLFLASVTFFLCLTGGIYLKLAERKSSVPHLDISPASHQPVPSFQVISTEFSNAVTLSAGLLNDFFVLDAKRLHYCYLLDSSNEELSIKERSFVDLTDTPTASHFVTNPESPLYGKLILAFSNRISLFDTETNNLNPYAELEKNVKISGITADERDLFISDAGNGCLYRINSEKQITEFGKPDGTTGFDGFQGDTYKFFDLDADPHTETIYATHPDKFRIEAFSALDGRWIRTRSWGNQHDKNIFSGKANPASIIVLGDRSFLIAEAGPNPSVKTFGADGKLIAEIDHPAVKESISPEEAPLVSITFTENRSVRLLILLPSGRLCSLTVPP